MNNGIQKRNNMSLLSLPASDLTLETGLEEKTYTNAEILLLLEQIRKAEHRICCLNQIGRINGQLRQALKGVVV